MNKRVAIQAVALRDEQYRNTWSRLVSQHVLVFSEQNTAEDFVRDLPRGKQPLCFLVQLYALALRYPLVARSRRLQDRAGWHLAAVAAPLPADAVAGAGRGRGRPAG